MNENKCAEFGKMLNIKNVTEPCHQDGDQVAPDFVSLHKNN